MVDGSLECNLRVFERIVIGEFDVDIEYPAFIRATGGTIKLTYSIQHDF